jgi:hypothetical protein
MTPNLRFIEGGQWWDVECGEMLIWFPASLGPTGPDDALPDFSDPATMGCLLALVREAWGEPDLVACNAGNYDLMFWHVWVRDDYASVGCDTEAAALVAALEAAP